MAYDHLSLESLQALFNEVRDALRKKQGTLTREQLLSTLSPQNPDFLGSGMSFQEFMLAGEVEYLQASYRRQAREERARRRDAVIALATELTVILAQTRQATLHARECIPAVINGDWREVRGIRDMLTFEGDFVGSQEVHGPIFAKFVQLLDEVLAGVPQEPAEIPALEPLS